MRVFRGFSPARTRDLWVFAGVKSTFAVSAYVQVFEMPNQAVWGEVINASCLLPPGREKRQEEETVYRCRDKRNQMGSQRVRFLSDFGVCRIVAQASASIFTCRPCFQPPNRIELPFSTIAMGTGRVTMVYAVYA